jgi:hypothetical protein
VALGARYLLLTGVFVGAVGVAGRFLGFAPPHQHRRAYRLCVRRPSPQRGGKVPQRLGWPWVAIGCGLGALFVFGLVRYPSVSHTGSPSAVQVAAAVIGVGLTVFALELAGSHHAPSAATALLITTGLAKPGAPLIGLVLGVAVGPLIGRSLLARRASTEEQSDRRQSPRYIEAVLS